MNFKTIEWKGEALVLIDQRKLPTEEADYICKSYQDVAEAIVSMVVRGAPAIGVTTAYGVALAARDSAATQIQGLRNDISVACEILLQTRPTAVNLRWAIDRMKGVCESHDNENLDVLKERLLKEAHQILDEDIETNRVIGEHGSCLIENGDTVLTHCNAGALATAGHGTALGVIYSAHNKGKRFDVFADETRPFLQGARLTAWELAKNDIPVTLITDNMAGYFMRQGKISSVIVGADRIAANGDIANKIGTYSVAVLAKEHKIPFYVAAPFSTIDTQTPTGEEIPIEERPFEEVTNFFQQAVAPEGIQVRNPAFDITPHELVTAIITEKGILRSSFQEAIAAHK
jgi:methylthioribose-1-phosphate isomerase